MSNILSRIQEIALNEGITIGALERQIGASKGVLSRAINNRTDIQSKWIEIIVENYPQYSTRWLLTGYGSMLHNKPEDRKTKDSPIATSSDAVILRLMDKIDEKDDANKQLTSELREMSEELGKLKAQLMRYQPENKIHQLEADDLGGKKTAKNVSSKKHSSQNADDATSVIVP